MKKKIIKTVLMLLTITLMFPMSVNAASQRVILSGGSSYGVYVDITTQPYSEDTRAMNCFRKQNGQKGQTFGAASNISKTNSSSATLSAGLNFPGVLNANTSLGIAYSQTAGSSINSSMTVSDTDPAGYYYIVLHFPQITANYKRYRANNSGKTLLSQQTIKDMQNTRYIPYYTSAYYTSIHTFTC